MVDSVPLVVSFIKNSINLIHQHRQGSLGAHNFSHFLGPGGNHPSQPRLTFFIPYLIDPHLIRSRLDFFLKIQNTFAAYKNEQEKTVVLFEDSVKVGSFLVVSIPQSTALLDMIFGKA